ncbi:glutamine-synthetase adenylyltransferase, partial [Thioclava sp. BHET1]
LSALPDYETRLDSARRWAKEWHFRIGVHHLRGLIDAFEAGRQYADLADAVLSAIWPPCLAEFSRKHGPPPGRGAVVLAMGSLGAGRLHSASDLDLIVIYDAAGVDSSDGPRPLAARPYYARLTQALVTALSAPTAEGKLYDVDMRLRPSGRQGPVATSIEAFRDYQRREAWTWEHLALTRARPVAGEAAIGTEVEGFREGLLIEKSAGTQIRADVAAMRERLAAAKPARSPWDARLGPGRLMDLELLAQTAALTAGSAERRVDLQLAAGRRAGFLADDEYRLLNDAYRLCWQIRCGSKLLSEAPLDPAELGEGGSAFLLRETGAADLGALAARLEEETRRAGLVVDRLLGQSGDARHGEAGDG